MDKDWKVEHKPFSKDASPKIMKKEVKNTATTSDEDPFDDTKPSRKQATFDEEKPGMKPWMWKTAIIAIIAILALFFLVLPAIKGYSAYSTMKKSGVPETYVENMIGLQQAKTDAETQAQTLQEQVNACAQDLSKVSGEITTVRDQAQQEVDKLNTAVDKCITEQDTYKEQAESLGSVVENAGKRICCIAKVENPAINAYAVVDDKITCVSEGGTTINCA